MYGVVRPPALQPPVINLVTSARNPTDDAGVRWQQGFSFYPESNVDPKTEDACDPSKVDNGSGAQPLALVDTVPWVVDAQDQCSLLGYQARDYIGRAVRALTAATPKGVEREFWTGTLTQAAGHPNLYLAMPAVANRTAGFGPIDVTPTPGTAVTMKRAFELLEDALAGCGAGARGMIHAKPGAVPSFLGVRRDGLLLLTPRDTIVVPGVGYTGTGPGGSTPAAGQTWLYATGLVDVRLDSIVVPMEGGEVEVNATADTGEPGDASWIRAGDVLPAGVDNLRPYMVNRATNSATAVARRLVAADWDGVCHFAVLATLDT